MRLYIKDCITPLQLFNSHPLLTSKYPLNTFVFSTYQKSSIDEPDTESA